MNLGFLSAAKMVHKKVASKLGIPADQAKIKAREEEEESSKQAGAAQGKPGELQKMKLKKSRTIKLSRSDSFKLRKQQFRWRNITGGGSANSSKKKGTQARASEGSPPNYMKSTSSSKAKKEVVQVSPKSPTTSKLKSPNDIMQPKHGSMLSSNKSPNTMMKKNSSLKPVRSLMKKNSTKALYPKLNVGRATCSSTLKETNNPAFLDLHPSEVEVERTSVMKVCPYTYCSLNGHHHHESLPSLKRFVSIRRGMLRAQKSMKLKGLSATEINHFGQDEEIGIDQVNVASSNAKVYPLVDDDTDFFVEIYVKPMNETTKKNPETQEEHDEIELNLSEASDTEKEDCATTEESIDELDEKVGFESKIGKETSDEVTKNSIPLILYEFTEKDDEEAARRNQSTTAKPEFKVVFNYCVGKDIEQLKLQIRESQDENPKQDGLFSNPADIDELHSCADGCGSCNNNRDNMTVAAEQQSLEINHSTEALKKHDDDFGALDIYGVSNPLSQDNHDSETASKFDVDGKEFILREDGKDKDMKSGQPEALERASDQTVDNIKQMEATDVSKLNEKLVTSENNQALPKEDMFSGSVTNQKNSISRGTQTDTIQEEATEEEVKKMAVPSKELVIHFKQEAHQLSPKTQHTEGVFQRTARKTIVRDESPFKEFNPVGPNFLLLEPNPETEKVDLKHQLMDERRRPEDWMLDHALQQAVGKLISGGRRRVNLLVKAFETIIPECETPLQKATSGFPQARPIQACR